ncbi:MAG: histidine kinase [Niabella sp.]
MLNRLFLVCLVFAFFSVNAQQQQIDSLYTLLKNKELSDTNRLKMLNNYSRLSRFNNTNEALIKASEALQLARAIKDEYWIAQSILSMSMIFEKMGEISLVEKCLDIAEVLFTKTKKYEALGLCLGQRSALLFHQGKLAEATDYNYRSLKLAEQTGDVLEQAKGYGEIANIYFGLELYEESIRLFDSAYIHFVKLKDSVLMGLCYANTGQAYINLKKYNEAGKRLDTAILFYKAAGREEVIDGLEPSIALVKAYSGDYDYALELIQNARIKAQKIGRLSWIARSNLNTARIMLLKMDGTGEINLALPLAYADEGLKMAERAENAKLQMDGMDLLAEIYERQGNYKRANLFRKNVAVQKDSVSNNNKIQEVAIKDLQYSNDKQQAILQATHTAQIKQQKTVRNFLMGGAGLLLLSGGALFWSYKRRTESKTKQQEAELKAQISDTETKVLRLQMNPHFIFNSLNSVSDYIRKNDTEEADAYLTKFAKAMRMTLENSEEKEIPLADDLKALDLYMQLEAKRLNHKFTYEIKVDEGIDAETTLVPPLLFQPFVENSIWHGISKKEGKGHILVQVKKEDEMLRCIIEDDGVGRGDTATAKLPAEKRSLGMKITKSRIDLLNKTKGSNASVSLKDKPQGVEAELLLPLLTI